MYVPAGRATPGISTGPLIVTYVSLSKSEACTGRADGPANTATTRTPARTEERRCMMCTPIQIETLDMRSRDIRFAGARRLPSFCDRIYAMFRENALLLISDN